MKKSLNGLWPEGKGVRGEPILQPCEQQIQGSMENTENFPDRQRNSEQIKRG